MRTAPSIAISSAISAERQDGKFANRCNVCKCCNKTTSETTNKAAAQRQTKSARTFFHPSAFHINAITHVCEIIRFTHYRQPPLPQPMTFEKFRFYRKIRNLLSLILLVFPSGFRGLFRIFCLPAGNATFHTLVADDLRIKPCLAEDRGRRATFGIPAHAVGDPSFTEAP